MTLLYKKTSGLNNKTDPVRHIYDREEGICELTTAINIDVDTTGMIKRSMGFTQIISGNYHSMCPFDCGGYTLAVSGTTMYAVDPEGGETTVRSNLTPGARAYFEEVWDGSNDLAYWVNGHERGRVMDRTNYSWNKSEEVLVDELESFGGPPDDGFLLCLFNGRMYVAFDKSRVVASEPTYFGLFNYATSVMNFSGEIHAMFAVENGIYVSHGKWISFLAGADMHPGEGINPFKFRRVFNSYIVPGMYVKTLARNVGVDAPGEGFLCYTPKGIVFAGDNGNVINRTYNSLSSRKGTSYLPDGADGSAMIMDDERLILTISK